MSSRHESRRREAQLGVRVHTRTKERFQEICKRKHLAVADVIEKLMRKWIKEHEK